MKRMCAFVSVPSPPHSPSISGIFSFPNLHFLSNPVIHCFTHLFRRKQDMTRTVKGYSLSEEALAKLAVLSEMEDRSASRVVERLILAAPLTDEGGRPMVPTPAELYGDGPIQAVKEKFETVPPSAEKRVEIKAATTVGPPKPVQDISSTKKVMPKINPMTGRPFGPVPK